MTKLKYSMMWMLAILVAGPLCADDGKFKNILQREVTKTFDVSSDVVMGVQNKYGNIDISTWDRNVIDVHVLIKVKANDKSRGQTFLDAVDIEFSATRAKVGMKTVYPDQETSSWWGSWWNNSNNLDYEVHYTINAPKGMSSNLINKYGTINQQSIGGSCDVVNKYGDIFLRDVGGDLNLDLGYGKSKIGNVGDARMIVKYSSVSLESCRDMTLDSKYSDYKFGNCQDMNITSKYDEYKIREAHEISNSGKYDDFSIGQVERFSIDTKYSDVRIDYLEKSFLYDGKYGSNKIYKSGKLDRVSIESKYTDTEIVTNHDFHLQFHCDKGDIYVQKPYDKFSKQEDGSEIRGVAYRGDTNAGAEMKVDIRYGSFRLHSHQD